MQEGTLLAQRYRIEEKLGEGGMGRVYKAHDTFLDRPVAIKTLSPHLFGEEGLKRLLREAQSAAKLIHPNIVAIHDVIDDGDARLIVMEYVAGRTLRELLPLPYAKAVEIAGQVCLALEYAHAHGVVHRDIKPENIIITSNGTAKVMDFGLARSEGRSRLTQTGMIVGTVAYMAPEQALSGRADGRSDLYSLGAVLYEAITTKPPFEAEDPISVISMHVNVPPVSPRFYAPAIPTVIESVILRLLAKDPIERYDSAEDLAHVLKASLTGESSVEAAAMADAHPGTTSPFDLMTRGRLIDREEELAALKGALESMLSGRGQVMLVAGEPGIGKTRLAEELLIYARLRGCVALIGRCYEQEINVPYLAFSEALLAAIHSLPDDRLAKLAGPYAAELVKLVPEVADRIRDLSPSPPLEPDQERIRLYKNVAGFVASLARTQPLVLMLDDLHWADAATLQLVRHLARNLRAERVLILGTYRDVEVNRAHPLSSALSEMNRERLYRRVVLRGLSADYVAAMVQSIFQAGQRVYDDLRDVIYTETEGNPFFVEEVLKHLVEVGALYVEGRQWRRKPIEEIDMPQSVREVIGRRLERVSETCQRVLSLAAVIGRRFRFEVLQSIGELPEEKLLESLEEATRAQLIREISRPGLVEYDFAHALIREVLYEQLGLRRRMMLHQKVGDTLERQYAGKTEAIVEDLAHHFTHAPQGEGLDKAIHYSLEAARKSMGMFAHEEAVRYYQNAAGLLDEVGNARRLAETYIALGEPFLYLDNTAAAVAAYERALKLYERQGSRSNVARVHRLIGRALQRHWDFSKAIPHLERALQHLDPEEHAADVTQTYLDLARAKLFSGMIEEAKRHAEQALNLARLREDSVKQADAQTTLGLIAVRRGDLAQAMAHHGEAITLARESSELDAYTLGRSLFNMAVLHMVRGEDEEALRLTREALEVSRRAKHFEEISFLNIVLSTAYYWRGDREAAKRHALDNLHMPLSPGRLQESESILRFLEGNLEGARPLVQDALEDNRRTGNEQGIFRYGTLLVLMNLDLGRLQEAREAAAEVARLIENHPHWFSYPAFAFIVEALALAGDHELCETLCARGEAFSRAANSTPGLVCALFGRAVLALERRDPHGAVTLLDEALPLTKQHKTVLHTHILRALAKALVQERALGDVERAKGALKECLALLEQMGDTHKADQVRTELASLA